MYSDFRKQSHPPFKWVVTAVGAGASNLLCAYFHTQMHIFSQNLNYSKIARVLDPNLTKLKMQMHNSICIFQRYSMSVCGCLLIVFQMTNHWMYPYTDCNMMMQTVQTRDALSCPSCILLTRPSMQTSSMSHTRSAPPSISAQDLY